MSTSEDRNSENIVVEGEADGNPDHLPVMDASKAIAISVKEKIIEMKEDTPGESPQAMQIAESSSDDLIDFGPKVAKVKRSDITVSEIQNLIVKCSACGKQINHNDMSQIKRHLGLGVLICKECFNFYGDGVFSEDEFGYNYCRWCAKGGKLYACDFCPHSFCMGCLRRNFARGKVHEIKERKWKCFVCDPSPMKGKVKFCDMIFEYCKNLKKEQKGKRSKLSQPAQRDQMSSDSEADESTVVPSHWLPFHICRIIHLSEKLDKRMVKLKFKHERHDKSTKQIVDKIEELITNHSKEIGIILKTINTKYDQYVQWKNKSHTEDDVVFVKSVLSSKVKSVENETLNESRDNKSSVKTNSLIIPITNGTDSSKRCNSLENLLGNSQLQDEDIGIIPTEKTSDNLRKESTTQHVPSELEILHCKMDSNENSVPKSLKTSIDSMSSNIEVAKPETEDECNSNKSGVQCDSTIVPKAWDCIGDDDKEQSQSLLSACSLQTTLDSSFLSADSKMVPPHISSSLNAEGEGDGNEKHLEDIPNKDMDLESNRECLSKNDAAKKLLLLKLSSSDSESNDQHLSSVNVLATPDSLPKNSPLLLKKNDHVVRSVAKKSFFGKKNVHKLKEKLLKSKNKLLAKSHSGNSSNDEHSYSSSNSVSSYESSDSPISLAKRKKPKANKSHLVSLIEKHDVSVACSEQVDNEEGVNAKENFKLSDDVATLLKDSAISFNDPKLLLKSQVVIEQLPLHSFGNKAVSTKDIVSDNKSSAKSLDIFDETRKMIKSTENLLKRKQLSRNTNESSSDNVDVIPSEKEKGNPKSKKAKGKLDDSDSEPFTLSSSPEEMEDIKADKTQLSTMKMLTKEQLAKESLLKSTNCNSTDSSSDDSENESTEDVPKKVKVKKDSEKDSESESSIENNSDDDFEVPKKKIKSHKLLTIPRCSSSSDSDSHKSRKSLQKGDKKKKSVKRKIFSSDENENAKNSKSSESNSSSDLSENKTKSKSKSSGAKKRRRIKEVSQSSDASDKDGHDNQDTPSGKGRKNIRKIISKHNLTDETKEAAQAEKERRKRVAERQRLYNQITDVDAEHGVTVTRKMVLEVNEESKEEVVEIHPDVVEKLKPHQINGVKFMWECTIESLKQLDATSGSGCILAHCMGLGKTLQVIAFLYTIFTNKFVKKKLRTALVICPYNTVLNWAREFEIWLKDAEEEINVFEMTNAKNSHQRKDILQQWQDEGGVMILSYNIFRRLAEGSLPKASKKTKEAVQSLIVDPGPDIVVCDEGHMLKNEASAISKATSKLKTQRRIVLTGTPLQNNLKEYHCMVHFVKPHLLGTRKEFQNRFVNPLVNGQCADSSQHDVKIMKKRVHILHKLLEGCVQRCDYSALTKFLPDKREFVISVKLSENQIKMYRYFLDHCVQGRMVGDKVEGRHLFSDYNALKNIWTHPYLYKMSYIRDQNKRVNDTSESDSMNSFINDETSGDESEGNEIVCLDQEPGTSKVKNDSSGDEIIKTYHTRSRRRMGGEGSEDDIAPAIPETHWWDQFFSEDDKYNLELSGKMVLVFEILKECELIGDKILIFSQSLLTLDMLEELLALEDEKSENVEEQSTQDILGSWVPGVDYFRMDGATSVELRKRWIDLFNDRENDRARLFLISTRAGSLGTNLVGANRVILLDASWNPSQDVQAIFRVYRFGQIKPVYIYRLLAQGTMEEKIYDRQVTKLSLSCRVVDEQNVERHFNAADLQALYSFDPESQSNRPTPMVPKDRLMAEMLIKKKEWIVTYHEHDSLLQNVVGDDLTEEERRIAWQEYENEKEGLINQNYMGFNDIFEDISGASAAFSTSETTVDVENHIKYLIEGIKSQNPKADDAYLLSTAINSLGNLQRHYAEKHTKVKNEKIKMVQRGEAVPADMNTLIDSLEKAIFRVRDCVGTMKMKQYHHFNLIKAKQQQRQQEQQRIKAQQQYSRMFTSTSSINQAAAFIQNAAMLNNNRWRNIGPNHVILNQSKFNQLRNQGITVTPTSSTPGTSTYIPNRMQGSSAYYSQGQHPHTPWTVYTGSSRNSNPPEAGPIITEIDESDQNAQNKQTTSNQNRASSKPTSVTITEVE